MVEFYLPLIWNLVPMVTSVGLAVAATLVAREIFARRTRAKQYRALGIMEDPFVSDHAVSRILDKREAVAREACDRGAFEFLLGHSRYRTFLGSEALPVGEGVDVTVSGKPVELEALEYFKVQLSTHGMKIKKGLWCRVILKGKLRAICG